MNNFFVCPVIISEEKGELKPYLTYIPAIDTYIQAKSVAESMELARDTLGEYSLKNDLPASSYELPEEASSHISVSSDNNDLITLIDVDVSSYKAKYDTRPVKKTVNIPKYLNDLGVEKKINFSDLLKRALIDELKI
ncbi:type II toxin-antitoxin system HicB family antitoxin [Streptococcaceae bacterium ESL0687]|nr:type II toxin-antitoxin system HicB family antitoxin [Streptococcaceae bacterium ESL0687]